MFFGYIFLYTIIKIKYNQNVPISLKPRTASGKDLLTIPQTKQYRVQRLKEDLDKTFVEYSTQQIAADLGLPYIDLYGFPIDIMYLTMITRDDVIRTRMGIFSMNQNDLYLATDSFGHEGQQELIENLKNQGHGVKIFVCSSISMEKIIKTFDQIVVAKADSDAIIINEERINQLQNSVNNLQNLQPLLMRASTSEFVETVLTAALENKASDIHFEPEKDGYHLRLRLDGVLYTFATLPYEKQKSIESRLKLVSGVKINIDNVPQDGRFSFNYNGRDIDVRVSMLPSNYGYSIVMRLLGTGDVNLKIEDLGFDGVNRERLLVAIDKPQGLILTTGPTGSGKTTTLYTILSSLNDGSNKIITLEDPVEYKLSGISQTQIDAAAGFTFGAGLRSILRQDPDVVMIGEIRDHETGDIAVQAALTGHKVLSTIHTNDAAGAIPRMLEMGAKGFILADALSIIIGQRLVRKICPHCRQPQPLDQATQNLVLEQIAALPQSVKDSLPDNINFYTSPGCEKCNNLGYKGRMGVYEVISMTDGLRSLLSNQFPSIVQVRSIARQEGMITMFQDGLLKAIQGITDLKELMRNVSP